MTTEKTTTLKGRPIVKGFFEKRTSSVQYVVADSETKRCAIIAPVLDFGATATRSADELVAYIAREAATKTPSARSSIRSG